MVTGKTFAGWLLVITGLGAPVDAGDPDPLVTGVTQIVATGSPGAVHPLSDAWSPVVAGDEDASFPSLFAASRSFGSGRVIAMGHDGLLPNADLLDNTTFILNMLSWLNGGSIGATHYTTGHSEWLTGGALAGVSTLLAGQGATLSALPAPLDTPALSGVSVLIVGNAWSSFTPAEVTVVEQWVRDGGGLLLAGLGWSWDTYHPTQTIEDYPMMQLAEPYAVRWLRNTISDPTNQLNGSPVFHTFHPDIEFLTVSGALTALTGAHQQHGPALPGLLETDPELRLDVVRAHQTLAIPAAELPNGHPQRQAVYDGLVSLVSAQPGTYARGFSFDAGAHPTATWLRERTWRTWRDAVPLTPGVKSVIAATGQLTGRRLDIFDAFDLVLLDNDSLGPAELELIHTYLILTPDGLADLWHISVRDALGTAPLEISLNGVPYGVNVFDLDVGQVTENPFPDDIAPIIADTFASVVAHEMNHVVDATTVGGAPALSDRRDMLIADAGSEPLNYLRSMISPGFFVNAPQEFFASISNQWFTDSAHTVALGIQRFDAGRPDPINQALFFADVYANGSDTSYLYTTSTNGVVVRIDAPLARNAAGFIERLRVAPINYAFDLDAFGRVTSYDAIVCPEDLDGSGDVGFADVLAVIQAWGTCIACAADVSGNGTVDFGDLLIVIGAWGPCS